MWVPARRHDPELMDRADNPAVDLERALADLAWVNRRLGGWRALRIGLSRWLRPGDSLEILDVGTGAGDLALDLAAAGRHVGCDVRVVAFDRDPVTAGVAARVTAAEPAVRIVQADARRPPFAPRTFDVVTASLFLHHFTHDQAVALLRGLLVLSRRAVVVNDLERHRLPWAFIWLVSRTIRRDRMFRHDAPLSVLRGFTHDELLRIGREVCGDAARVLRAWPFRLIMVLEAR